MKLCLMPGLFRNQEFEQQSAYITSKRILVPQNFVINYAGFSRILRRGKVEKYTTSCFYNLNLQCFECVLANSSSDDHYNTSWIHVP